MYAGETAGFPREPSSQQSRRLADYGCGGVNPAQPPSSPLRRGQHRLALAVEARTELRAVEAVDRAELGAQIPEQRLRVEMQPQ